MAAERHGASDGIQVCHILGGNEIAGQVKLQFFSSLSDVQAAADANTHPLGVGGHILLMGVGERDKHVDAVVGLLGIGQAHCHDE